MNSHIICQIVMVRGKFYARSDQRVLALQIMSPQKSPVQPYTLVVMHTSSSQKIQQILYPHQKVLLVSINLFQYCMNEGSKQYPFLLLTDNKKNVWLCLSECVIKSGWGQKRLRQILTKLCAQVFGCKISVEFCLIMV